MEWAYAARCLRAVLVADNVSAAPMPVDNLDSIVPVLDTLVDAIAKARAQGSAVVAHATDDYRKHGTELDKFYRKINSAASTPIAKAAVVTTITGDPAHDLFAFRRLVSPSANDAKDLKHDHKDIMSRLSAEMPSSTCDFKKKPSKLHQRAHGLLRSAVEDPVKDFQEKMNADEIARDALVAFIQQPNVSKAGVWKKLFHACPPRGTFARIAGRLGVEVHETMAFRNFRTVAALKREIRRVPKWYKTGKRTSRFRRGLQRHNHADNQVCGILRAWTKKATLHYTRLLKPLRLEGLWQWRKVALDIRAAGIPVQSGTIPCERCWAFLKDMFPAAGKRITPRWYRLLAQLAFLRFNYRHYAARHFPGWTEGDSLLSQRIDTLVMYSATMQNEQGGEPEHLQSLFDPFR